MLALANWTPATPDTTSTPATTTAPIAFRRLPKLRRYVRDLMITPRRWTSMFTGWGAIRGREGGRFNAVPPAAPRRERIME
ncbi:hypothetical protein Asi03nite_22430 [Actinoplanes siamensis]|uniref:Uncharacterized protein n=1 Tax=Actinoplanes siamensis TaxID=1223317 RepID=A0A919TJX1_9ACTN|nr:hypothetical protein Asi03nite_22430 [Actinoplanes siamensis]